MSIHTPTYPTHINPQSHRLTHLQKSSLSLSARAPATSAYLGAQILNLKLSFSVTSAQARAATSLKKQKLKQHSTTTASSTSDDDGNNKQRGKKSGQTSRDANANLNSNTYVGKRKGGGKVEFCGGCGAPLLVGWSAKRRVVRAFDHTPGVGDGVESGGRIGVVQINGKREGEEGESSKKSRRPSKRRKMAWDVPKAVTTGIAESVVVDDAGAATREEVATALQKGGADQDANGGALKENGVRAGTSVGTKEDEILVDGALTAAANMSQTRSHVQEPLATLPASSPAGPTPQSVVQLRTTCLRCHRTTRETASTLTAAPGSPLAAFPSSSRPTSIFKSTSSANMTDPPADDSPNHRLSTSAVPPPTPVHASQAAARTGSKQATQAPGVLRGPSPRATDPTLMAVPTAAAAAAASRTTRLTKAKAPATRTAASKTRARAKARKKGLGGLIG